MTKRTIGVHDEGGKFTDQETERKLRLPYEIETKIIEGVESP
jgi:hypothetical protein